MKELVLIGGGHSHAIVIRELARFPLDDTRLTVVSDFPRAVYSGMLPGFIAGYYLLDEIQIDIAALASCAGARFVQDEVTGLDLDGKQVVCANGCRIAFDLLSINVGSIASQASTPGAKQFSIPVKPVLDLLKGWEETLKMAASGRRLKIAVVGGGAGGVELIFAIRKRLGELVELHLIHNKQEVMEAHNLQVRKVATSLLKLNRVCLHLNETVVLVEKGVIHCSSGLSVEGDAIFWATGACPPAWIKTTELAVDSAGFIAIKPTLQSTSHDFVFAAGDVASIEGYSRPKSGVFAVRQGKPLWENLSRWINNEKPNNFIPQQNFLSLIGTGDKAAIASRGRWGFHAKWLWWLKQKIDRKFMNQFPPHR